MERFVPVHVFYEEKALDYPLGAKLFRRYDESGVPLTKIDDHNNIPEFRRAPDEMFPKLKKYLIIGVRKSLAHVPNRKTSDYLVPFTSSGCPAMCLYCYLVCTYFKGAYLRVFVNREAMMDRMKKKAEKSEKPLVFEIGSNSDLVIENTVTGNLEWAVKEFAAVKNAYITLPTKFHMIDSLLDIEHNKRTTVRMSVNPEPVIKKVELGTSPLEKRLNAMNRLFKAGYRVGMLLAPVVLMDGWETMYEDLLKKTAARLNPGLTNGLPVEIIFMTYGYAHRQINPAAFPNAVDLFSPEKMRPRGRGKYMYKKAVAEAAGETVRGLVKKYLPKAHIVYVC